MPLFLKNIHENHVLDTSDATAVAEDIRVGKTAYINGQKVVGTLVPYYTQLQYIENINTEHYFDTGVRASSNIGVELDVQVTNKNGVAFFGAWQNGVGLMFGQHNGYGEQGEGYYIATSGGWKYTNVAFDLDKSHRFVYDPVNNIMSVDGVTVDTPKNNGASYNLWLFRAYEWGENSTGVRISRCKIYNSGQLTNDFIPVIRGEDNVVCMYDLVKKQFIEPQGTGTFIAGPAI